VDDLDAPGGTWTHWVIYNIPATEAGLKEGTQSLERLGNGSRNGKNSWGKLGYGGPCPPSGTHRYFFKLYALDRLLGLSSGASAAQLVKAMQGHILATAELMGTYRK
jgi:Raf kinase inhibitor-like YbhB/YbcL family protein